MTTRMDGEPPETQPEELVTQWAIHDRLKTIEAKLDELTAMITRLEALWGLLSF